MKIITRTAFTLPVFLLALTAAAAAQQAPAKLPTGIWTGKVTPPDEAIVDITLEVMDNTDGIAITLNAGSHGTFKTDGIKVEADRFTFSFVPGPVVVCVLSRQEDATYAGDCTADGGGGGAARMIVSPPQPKN